MINSASAKRGRIRSATLACATVVFAASLVAQRQQSGFAVAGRQSSAAGESSQVADRGCPISMYARHGVGGFVMKARGKTGEQPERAAEPSQHIHLVLGKAGEVADVAGIKVLVRGTSGRNRSVGAGGAGFSGGILSDASRSFDLPVKIAGGKTVATDLILSGFTSVQSITLEAVAYADGSRWTASEGQSCRIAPDALMLVGRR